MFYSYDIFDTILYRRVPKSVDTFYVMEQYLQGIWPKTSGSFGDVRKESEFWLRRIRRREISIEDIYGELQKKVTGIDVKRLIEIEYKVEKEQSFLNRPIVNEIKQHLAGGDQVILISDMYWHENQIRNWLVEKDDVFRTIPMYISCDYGVTKNSGKLFAKAKEDWKIQYKLWTHTGDNKESDGRVPASLGITVNVIPGSKRYDFESKIGHSDMSMLTVYGIIAEARTYSNGTAFNLGVSVSAPMVYQYVNWVLSQAEKKGLKKLFFVLRDGYILKIVADNIINSRGLNIETEFLFGSRVAWRFPEISIEKLHSLSVWEKSNWIFRDPAVTYVPFERLGFRQEKLDELFGADFGKKELHTFGEFKLVLEEALKKKEFVTELTKNIKEAGDNLNSYLISVLDFSVPFALVDTNSTGKTQRDLNAFLKKRHAGLKDLTFFYHTYLADNKPDKETQFVFITANEADRRFPEAFYRAPYNPCYGYKKTESGIEPQFHKSEKCAWFYSFDYDSYLTGIIAFTEAMEKHLGQGIELDSYVSFLLKVVNFDITSRDEIRQVATMPFNPDINGDEVLDFYPALNISAVLHPFSKLIYYPKGSYYNAGGLWILIYKVLYGMAKLKRKRSK